MKKPGRLTRLIVLKQKNPMKSIMRISASRREQSSRFLTGSRGCRMTKQGLHVTVRLDLACHKAMLCCILGESW